MSSGDVHPNHPYRRLSKNGTWYPKWIPCLTCGKPLDHHIGRTCPFDPTEFSPDEETIVLILEQMQVTSRLHLDQLEAVHGMRPRNVVTLSMDTERYLAAHAVLVEKNKLNWEE